VLVAGEFSDDEVDRPPNSFGGIRVFQPMTMAALKLHHHGNRLQHLCVFIATKHKPDKRITIE
jgi:hypothetical protein